MNENLKISDAEWEVMEVIWEKSPLTAEEIIVMLETKIWSAQTVKTFISRLIKKGAIGFEKSGRSYLYYPMISEKQFKKKETRSFLDRVYGGRLKNLFSNFLDSETLTDEEIEYLRKVISDKQEKKDSG